MCCTGKLQAQAVIDGLQTSGATNLISANKLALSLALNDSHCSNVHIVILTDGEPGYPELVLPEFFNDIAPLERARVEGRHHGVCVSTFGFGYDMNSVRPNITPPPLSHSPAFSGTAAAAERRRPRHVLLHTRRVHDRHRLLQLHRKRNVRMQISRIVLVTPRHFAQHLSNSPPHVCRLFLHRRSNTAARRVL
jgi:hypothetical protein